MYRLFFNLSFSSVLMPRPPDKPHLFELKLSNVRLIATYISSLSVLSGQLGSADPDLNHKHNAFPTPSTAVRHTKHINTHILTSTHTIAHTHTASHTHTHSITYTPSHKTRSCYSLSVYIIQMNCEHFYVLGFDSEIQIVLLYVK